MTTIKRTTTITTRLPRGLGFLDLILVPVLGFCIALWIELLGLWKAVKGE